LCTRVITNTLELNLQDVQTFRSVAYFMMESGQFDEAVSLYERVLELMPGEPHSHLDLALALFLRIRIQSLGKTQEDQIRSKEKEKEKENTPPLDLQADLQRSVGLLQTVIKGDWPSRFDEIEWPALLYLHWIVNYACWRGFDDLWPNDLSALRVSSAIEFGLVVSMAWDTDNTDIDLHVKEPSGEEVYYGNRNPKSGGYLSKDFTQGYGPEVYVVGDVKVGTYQIVAHYFGSHQQSQTTGATSVVLWCVSNFGSFTNEQFCFSMVRLNSNKQQMHVMDARIDKPWDQTSSQK